MDFLLLMMNMSDMTDFMPHGHCYFWRPDILWTHVLSDAAIALAYTCIPLTLIYFISKRKDLHFQWIFLAFGLFIIMCGITHIFAIITVWNPIYEIQSYIKAFTALISLVTAVGLILIIPKALAIPSLQQLKEANNNLKKEADSRKKAQKELLLKTEELERSNEELEKFAYIASHDLQEPLRMVASYVGLLEKRYKDKLDEDAKDFIGFAVDGASRMQSLIASLLEYSRVGTKEILRTKVNTEEILKTIQQDLRNVIKSTNTVIEYKNLDPVFADEVQFRQLLQNLIANAIKFRKKEEKINPIIKITSTSEKDCVKFTVSDNGIGIDKKYYEKVFTIFQRLNNREEFEGTGIGLAICKKIVERHLGTIRIEENSSGGCSFIFTISHKS